MREPRFLRDTDPPTPPGAKRPQPLGYPCPFGACDSSGFLDTDRHAPVQQCRCRPQRLFNARLARLKLWRPTGRLGSVERQATALSRLENWRSEILPAAWQAVSEYVAALEERRDRGEGLWLVDPRPWAERRDSVQRANQADRARRDVDAEYASIVDVVEIPEVKLGAEETYAADVVIEPPRPGDLGDHAAALVNAIHGETVTRGVPAAIVKYRWLTEALVAAMNAGPRRHLELVELLGSVELLTIVDLNPTRWVTRTDDENAWIRSQLHMIATERYDQQRPLVISCAAWPMTVLEATLGANTFNVLAKTAGEPIIATPVRARS